MKKTKEEQDKLEKPKLENVGLNCPRCNAWIPNKGNKTVCAKCGWKAK